MAYSDFVVKHRVGIIIVCLIISAICGLCMLQVHVNYNMVDYLPEDAPSTIALHTMQDQYSGGIPNARVMLNNVTIPQTVAIKDKIKSVDGVTEVTWLDTVVDIEIPMAYLDADTVDDYYRDGSSLLTLTIEDDKGIEAVKEVRAIVGEESPMAGMMVSQAFSGDNLNKDLQKILILAFPVILIILLFTTRSWFEPILFLAVIGVAIVINMGTNLVMGEISYVTKGVAALLQLAISIDYAIFLLHRFDEYTDEGMAVVEAMKLSMKKAALSIWTSGITAAIGFAGLCVMQFKIGPDLGIVMVKGIFISLLCVFTLLPALTICCRKLMIITRHRPLLPTFKHFAKFVKKFSIPCLIVMLIIFVPCVMAVENNHYIYLDTYNDPNTQVGKEIQAINDKFGISTSMVLMVPIGNAPSEKEIHDIIKEMPEVRTVLSYSGTVGNEIPQAYVPAKTLEKLISPEYTRFVLTVELPVESDESFAFVERMRALGEAYYPGSYHLVGEMANAYDMRTVVKEDDVMVNLIAIGGIILVLLIIFRSLIIPLILVFVINAMIWINCSVPYFAGEDMVYVVRIIIFALQLAATVDYGILFASRYFEYRKVQTKDEALVSTISTTFVSILTSAAILFVCGLLLSIISSDSLLSMTGTLVARGSVLAIIAVMFVLPALLRIFDTPIQKLSLNMKFLKEEKGRKTP